MYARIAKTALLAALVALALDSMAAAVLARYVHEALPQFAGKSGLVLVSDLLFMEGSLAFGIGTIAMALRYSRPSKKAHGRPGVPAYMAASGVAMMLLSIISSYVHYWIAGS